MNADSGKGASASICVHRRLLAVGSDADLAIVDLNLEKTVTAALLKGYADFSL